jgi:hypothetical protein
VPGPGAGDARSGRSRAPRPPSGPALSAPVTMPVTPCSRSSTCSSPRQRPLRPSEGASRPSTAGSSSPGYRWTTSSSRIFSRDGHRPGVGGARSRS